MGKSRQTINTDKKLQTISWDVCIYASASCREACCFRGENAEAVNTLTSTSERHRTGACTPFGVVRGQGFVGATKRACVSAV